MARTRVGTALMIAGAAVTAASAQDTATARNCKAVHAVLIEQQVTVGCKPGHTSCFIGEVAGNHGLRGTTYFRGDSRGVPATTSPDFMPYGGAFEYHTSRGTLLAREAGLSNTSQGNPESGAVLAFQKIVDATGDLTGTTGYFFVNGFNRNGRVETQVTGEICLP